MAVMTNTATSPSVPDIDDDTTVLDDDVLGSVNDGRGRLSFYLRPTAQGGRWMTMEFIMKADGTGPEEVVLRGRTNPKSDLKEDRYLWNASRVGQLSAVIKKRHEAGYTQFGGPVESHTPLNFDQMRNAWRAACGETDPPVRDQLVQFIGKDDGDVIADVILNSGFTIDYTSAIFGTRVKGAEQYVRPNGEVYYARELGSETDVKFLQKARGAGMSCIFSSPPGVGKTALVEAAFPDCISVDGTGETEVSDFIGQFVPDANEAGKYEWVDGPFTRAAVAGVPFFVDELSRINPQVLTIIYPAMDGRGRFTAPGRPAAVGGPEVVCADGFYIVAAYNPNIPGCRIDEPLMSRFALHVEMSTCYRTAKILGVPDECVKAAEKLNELRLDPAVDLDWAPQLRECIRFKKNTETFGPEVAWQALVGAAPAFARPAIMQTVTTYAKAKVPALAVGAAVEA